ncbi:MAG: hypothetical protein GX907_00280 [Clostridiaceae bacterium]|nr:hypothetical protein [Clostridiaceae bacterium]
MSQEPEKILGGEICRETLDLLAGRVATLAGTDREVFLYPHVRADADALGSCLAMQEILRQIGVRSRVIAEESTDEVISFVNTDGAVMGVCGYDEFPLERQAMAIALDNSGGSRLGKRMGMYDSAPERWIIDHHIPDQPDESPHIWRDTAAAACCEMLTRLGIYWQNHFPQLQINADCANILMMGLLTDTGRFLYANTTSGSFQTAAYLVEHGARVADLNLCMYDALTETQMRLRGLVFQRVTSLCGGRIMIDIVTCNEMREYKASEDDLSGVASELRRVSGVELAVMLREVELGKYRASVRSDDGGAARRLALRFGGGGHAAAAGFSLWAESPEDCLEQVKAAATEEMSCAPEHESP